MYITCTITRKTSYGAWHFTVTSYEWPVATVRLMNHTTVRTYIWHYIMYIVKRRRLRFVWSVNKVSKGAKIRNRHNQVPHLTQDTDGKVTNSQLDTTNENQEVSPFPAGDHKAHINRRSQRHSKRKTEQEISLKKIFGGSQILTILTQLNDEIPLYPLSLHAGKGCSI